MKIENPKMIGDNGRSDASIGTIQAAFEDLVRVEHKHNAVLDELNDVQCAVDRLIPKKLNGEAAADPEAVQARAMLLRRVGLDDLEKRDNELGLRHDECFARIIAAPATTAADVLLKLSLTEHGANSENWESDSPARRAVMAAKRDLAMIDFPRLVQLTDTEARGADAALFDLYEQMRNLEGQSDGSDNVTDRIVSEQSALVDRIIAIQATTLQGLAVKMLALYHWVDPGGDAKTAEQNKQHDTDGGIIVSTGLDAKRLLGMD